MKAILFDVETTGLRLPTVANKVDQPRIIEIGAVATDGERVTGTISRLIHPGFLISEEITKITGIKREDLTNAPKFPAAIAEMKALFRDADFLIAHNAPFDVAMLTHELELAGCVDFPWPTETICTAQEYGPMFGFNPTMAQIYEKVLGKPLEQKHRALDDCEALFEALRADGFFANIGVV